MRTMGCKWVGKYWLLAELRPFIGGLHYLLMQLDLMIFKLKLSSIGGALLFFAQERRSVWLFVFLVQPSYAFFELNQSLPAISEVHRPSRTNDQLANYAIMHNDDPPPGLPLRTAWNVFIRLSKIPWRNVIIIIVIDNQL